MLFRRVLEKRSSMDLADQQLLELLGINPSEVNVRGKNALKVDTVYACIRILSGSVSKLPLKTYQEDENGIQKASRHYLFNLLKLRPNPFMSASDFWKCIEAQRDFGNAYASIDFDQNTGQIKGLWPIDSSRVTIWIDDVGFMETYYSGSVMNGTRIWYEVDVGNERRRLLPHEILHFKGSVTLDGMVGIDPMLYLRNTIENASSSTQFINNFYKQGLQTKGIIQYVGDLNEEAKRKFRDKFEEMSSGLKNSHRVSLMPVGYQFQPLSLSMTDAQFLENTELTIRQIATAFGIKMHQLNDLSRATHTNIGEQQRQFYIDTLMEILTSYEQELTWKLFTQRELDTGYYVKFNVDSMLRGDIEKRYKAYREGIQGAFLTPNEARQQEELPPAEGGDRLYANGNFIPLTMAGKQYVKIGGKEDEKEIEGNEGNSSDTSSIEDS